MELLSLRGHSGQWEVTETVCWGEGVCLGVHPAGHPDQVRHVGGEDTGEDHVVPDNDIDFEHVSIELLRDN